MGQGKNQSVKERRISLKEAFERGLRPAVIVFPVATFLVMILMGIKNGKAFISAMTTTFENLVIHGGWLISFGTLFFVVFMLFLLIHPIGKVKLGGADAVPEYDYWNWFAISLCAGVGTGLVFWGGVEPLAFVVNPQLSTGIVGNTREAVLWGMNKTYLHWSFAPYACYGIFAVCIAYAYYNMNREYAVSSAFAPILKNTVNKKWFKGIIDTLTVFAITGGVAGSLGYGILQIGSGISKVFHVETGIVTSIIVCIVIVAAYNLSSISGMSNGIRWLSDKNAWIFIFAMLLAFLFGPMSWTCNLFVECVGNFLSNFVETLTATSAFSDTAEVVGSIWYENSELWPQWWDQGYFVDYLAFAPITGLFLVKLGKGRTIREFVMMNWCIPAIFALIWYTIFGALALDIQYNYAAYADRVNLEGCSSLYDYMLQFGNESVMLKILEAIPLSFLWKPLFLVLIVLSFVTLADSMTSTVSLLTIERNNDIDEAPASIKLFWGVIMGGAALVFTLTGNIEGIKEIKTLAGYPILLMGIVMVIMFIVYAVKYQSKLETTGLEN